MPREAVCSEAVDEDTPAEEAGSIAIFETFAIDETQIGAMIGRMIREVPLVALVAVGRARQVVIFGMREMLGTLIDAVPGTV